MAQFNERRINGDVADLRKAVSEMQIVMNMLIDRINNCEGC